MKLNMYYFENYSQDTPFDLSNPRYVLSLAGVEEVLSALIKNKAYSLKVEDFENRELIQQLLYVDVLQEKEEKLALKIPFFIEEDAEVLKGLSIDIAKKICEKLLKHQSELNELISKVNNGFSNKRNLYHLLCGLVFDGYMFDYLEEHQLVTTSLMHPSGLDYLIVLYENCEKLNTYSQQLLCSFNRYNGFVSFGDSQGSRKDFYRYLRLKELHQLNKEEERYISFNGEDLRHNFIKLLQQQDIDKKYKEIFEYFGYYKKGQIIVPIYNKYAKQVGHELYRYVLGLIEKELAEALTIIKDTTKLTVIHHDVAIKDIANEIYHLIFGEVNEHLVENGLVSKPLNIDGEGRYFRCFEL